MDDPSLAESVFIERSRAEEIQQRIYEITQGQVEKVRNHYGVKIFSNNVEMVVKSEYGKPNQG